MIMIEILLETESRTTTEIAKEIGSRWRALSIKNFSLLKAVDEWDKRKHKAEEKEGKKESSVLADLKYFIVSLYNIR